MIDHAEALLLEPSERASTDAVSRAAIVTTLRAAGAYLENFARYHLAIGFAHLYLFLDDAAEAVPEWLHRDDRVTLIPRDEQLEALWHDISSEHDLLGFVYAWRERETMARQQLNVKVAIDLARAARYEWLLSIDVDELFHCAKTSVTAHFQTLNALGLKQIHYANHELVLQTWQPANIVREETVFKLSPSLVDEAKQRWYLSRFPQHTRYFNYYTRGKAAARIEPGLLPGLTVHEFTVPGQILPSLETAFQPATQTRQYRRPDLHANPCILHYAIAGFDEFVRKYRILGRFPDKWFGHGANIQTVFPFHTAARDALAQGDAHRAERFFRERVLVSPEDVAALLDRGICGEFRAPSSILHAAMPRLADTPPPL